MSEITVVIPNYNGMKYLAECMTSLCREQQNAPGYEVLIIDNASVDGSVEYLQKEWVWGRCAPDIFTGKHRILSCSESGDTGSEDTICDPSEQ